MRLNSPYQLVLNTRPLRPALWAVYFFLLLQSFYRYVRLKYVTNENDENRRKVRLPKHQIDNAFIQGVYLIAVNEQRKKKLTEQNY